MTSRWTEFKRQSKPTPDQPLTGPVAWFGRPVHRETRVRQEHRELRRSPLWNGVGIPPGRDRPLLIVPGFLAGPRSVRSLERVLSAAGWRVRTAAVGRNSGPAYHSVDAATDDLHRLAGPSNERVTIVGHSRGGQMGRVLAVRYAETVAQVVALGSPLLVKYPSFAPLMVPAELLDRTWRAGAFGDVDPDRESAVDRDRWGPFPNSVDFVSIYSRSDGFVDWRTCRDPAAHLIEVESSHRGLVQGVPGFEALARALARQDGEEGEGQAD
jgi:pimeloyl-ACP methyl ester carboxylesterase